MIQNGGFPRKGTGDAISFRGLRKQYGEKLVIEGIDLEIEAGQFVAIIGRSGCGKSTLLRLMAGLDAPTAGTISHGNGSEGFADIRMMFQEPRLLPWERVARNVEVGLTGIAKGEEAQERSLSILREVGLEDRAGEWPSILSGGQKQRVALARALVGRPRILALDEPLGALDALTRIEMQGLLEQVWQSQGFTAVLVTHDVGEAVALADRVIVLEGGRITLDLPVPLPRPRRRGSLELTRLEDRILRQLFGEPEPATEQTRQASGF